MHLQWEFPSLNAFLTRLTMRICVCMLQCRAELREQKNGLNDAQNYLISGEVRQLDASSRGRKKKTAEWRKCVTH